MMSWLAAKLVPSYAQRELKPYWKEPPENVSGQEEATRRAVVSGSSCTEDEEHDCLVLGRRGWDVDIQVQAVLALPSRRRRRVVDFEEDIADGGWVFLRC